jgi:hypothetical protein
LAAQAEGACGKPDALKGARPVWRAGRGNGAAATRPPRPVPTRLLAFDNRNADLIFQVVSRRYEKKSLVLTTNLAFADWHTVFPSATCATALVERVVHHADIVKIEGESYRLRESQQDANTRDVSRRDKKKNPDS